VADSGDGSTGTAGYNIRRADGDLTLQVQWRVDNYTDDDWYFVTFNAKNVKSGSDPITTIHINKTSPYDLGIGEDWPTVPLKDGYDFVGWSPDSGAHYYTTQAAATTALTGEIVTGTQAIPLALIAIWAADYDGGNDGHGAGEGVDPQNYWKTITFDQDGGTNDLGVPKQGDPLSH
jgi:hypothetical protein